MLVTNARDTLRRERKYTTFWGVFLFASVALFFDKLNGDQWVELLIFIFGLYMAGNVGEHYTRKAQK